MTLKVATGTNERNGPEGIKNRGELKLVAKDNPPKKIYRIGICENVFSPRGETITKTGMIHRRSENETYQLDGASREAAFATQRDTLITCALFGLVLGYLAGRLGR
jgi:hypothetical protein